jgi:hypothetical protein
VTLPLVLVRVLLVSPLLRSKLCQALADVLVRIAVVIAKRGGSYAPQSCGELLLHLLYVPVDLTFQQESVRNVLRQKAVQMHLDFCPYCL